MNGIHEAVAIVFEAQSKVNDVVSKLSNTLKVLDSEFEAEKQKNAKLSTENIELKDKIKDYEEKNDILEKKLDKSKKLFSETEITHHPRED